MLVRSIEKGEKGKRKILIDNQIIYLYEKERKKFHLEEGSEISEEVWGDISHLLEVRGKKWVYHLLAKRDYTHHIIGEKLKKAHYPECVVEGITDYFKEKNFLDDENYIVKYYRYHKHYKSRRMIERDLWKKGINKELVKSFFDKSFDLEAEKETATQLLIKKMRHKEKTEEIRFKTIRYLMGKGFEYETIKGIVHHYWER